MMQLMQSRLATAFDAVGFITVSPVFVSMVFSCLDM